MYKKLLINKLLVGTLLTMVTPLFGMHDDDKKPISTLFCHGLNAGPAQAARYIPEHISSITGEKITCNEGISVLQGPVTAPAMPEIQLQKSDTKWSLYNVLQKINGWRNGRKHHKAYGIHIEPFLQNATGITLNAHTINTAKTNIGQEADIETLHSAYTSHLKEYPNHDSIVCGGSRGAAAAFCMMCRHKPAVKAVVLEGCFDSIPSMLAARYSWLVGKRGVTVIESILERCMAYKKTGISPISVAGNWPANVPLLFVTSDKDEQVTSACTKNLIAALKKNVPNAHVHLVTLRNASHSRYTCDNKADKEIYENAVHAFYKKYGISHDASKAEKGAQFLVEVSD